MYAKVCDICEDIISRANGEILNGDKVLIHICAETENKVQDFDLCYECFAKHFQNSAFLERIDNQIIKELNEQC